MSIASPSARLVVVTGSGRSGTSSMAGVLKLLGLRIPQPEVPATRSNPKGHFEPQWVVDFQQRLLGRVQVKLTDARPEAFDDTARVGLRTDTQEKLREWLAPQLTDPADVVVKDPRSTWFVPMWKQVAEDLGADLATLTMLRHPAEVVGSKNAYYYRKESPERRRVGETSRVASWVNVALFGELATRGRPRSFVRYTDLLIDWRKEVERIAKELDLGIHDGLPDEGVVDGPTDDAALVQAPTQRLAGVGIEPARLGKRPSEDGPGLGCREPEGDGQSGQDGVGLEGGMARERWTVLDHSLSAGLMGKMRGVERRHGDAGVARPALSAGAHRAGCARRRP